MAWGQKMVAYKVFRVVGDRLESAFERESYKLHLYHEAEVTKDRKEGSYNPGLMILLDFDLARKWLYDCGGFGGEVYALFSVYPQSEVRSQVISPYKEAFTDSLLVGRYIENKKIVQPRPACSGYNPVGEAMEFFNLTSTGKEEPPDEPPIRENYRHFPIEVGEKRPYVVTLCTLSRDNQVLAMGLSICSYLDQFNRKLGSRIAHGRAVKAYSLEENISPITRPEFHSIVRVSHKGLFIRR
jgi:hypothetical protein